MPSSSRRSGVSPGSSFQEFFQGWLVRQEQLMNELLEVQESTRTPRSGSDDESRVARDLVSRVLTHYQEYYSEKSRMANANVFLAFSPTWFTSMERTLLWIAGFKPGLVCRLTMKSVDDLTEDQIRRVETLSRDTKRREKALDEDMARIQESLGSPAFSGLARRQAGYRPVDGEIDEVGDQIETLKSAMVNVLSDADGLRIRTSETMVGILSPLQNVKLFAAAAQLQFRIRMLGIERDNERNGEDSSTNGW